MQYISHIITIRCIYSTFFMYICILLHVDLTSQYILHITSICSCNSNVVNCTDQNSPDILLIQFCFVYIKDSKFIHRAINIANHKLILHTNTRSLRYSQHHVNSKKCTLVFNFVPLIFAKQIYILFAYGSNLKSVACTKSSLA